MGMFSMLGGLNCLPKAERAVGDRELGRRRKPETLALKVLKST